MKHDSKFRGLRLMPALVLLLLVASLASDGSTSSPTYMIGTVRVVDVEARTLEVIAGVGHALRVVRMQVADGCEISVAGAPSRLASVERGACVRVEYVAAEVPGARAERVAVVIEAVPMEGTAEAP